MCFTWGNDYIPLENAKYGLEFSQEMQDAGFQNGDKVLLGSAIAQQEGKGGFMLDLSIGRSIRMKKGNLSINLSITNLLNNQNMVTGGYEQSRSNYSVSDDGTVGNARVYKFNRNPMKFYAYGINGMLNIGYNF